MWKGFFESLSCEVRALFGIRNVYIMLNNTAVYTKISFFSSLDVAHVLLTTSPYPSPLPSYSHPSLSYGSVAIRTIWHPQRHLRLASTTSPFPIHPITFLSAAHRRSRIHVYDDSTSVPLPVHYLFILSGEDRVSIHGRTGFPFRPSGHLCSFTTRAAISRQSLFPFHLTISFHFH